jgi:flagellar motor switch protein FliM
VKKILNQDEIDALFKKAQGGDGMAPGGQKSRQVTACNFRQAGIFSKDHVRSISALHDTFARNLSHSLGAFLRVRVEVNLVSVEQLSYMEFLERVPELSFVGAIRISPLEASAVMQFDLGLAFPLIDLLLGGKGQPGTEVRELTEIEEQVLATVVKIICRELQPAWQSVASEFVFEGRQPQAQVIRLMPTREKVLSVSFELQVAGVQGNLNFAFPAVASGALLRTLAQQWLPHKSRSNAESAGRIRKRLLKCPFTVSLSLPGTRLPARALTNLAPGQVISLQWKVERPALLVSGGRPIFNADPVASGNARSAQLRGEIEPYENER